MYISFFSALCLLASRIVSAESSIDSSSANCGKLQTVDSSIIVEYRCDLERDTASRHIKVSPVEIVSVSDWEWEDLKSNNEQGAKKWTIRSKQPTYVMLNDVLKNEKPRRLILMPGDSIVFVREIDGHLTVNGRGRGNYILPLVIDSVAAIIKKPKNPKDVVTVSLDDYFEWDRYLNRRLEYVLPVIESFRSKLSDYAYNHIRAEFIDQNLDDRSDKFASFFFGYARQAKMSREDLCRIYDTTYALAASKYYPMASEYVFGTWKPILFDVVRKYSFDYANEAINSEAKRNILYYNAGTSILKGRVRELFIQKLITKYFIKNMGFTPETEMVLSNYFKEPGYPEYKAWLKQFELKRRELLNERSAFDFALTDKNGMKFTKQNLLGKIAVFDFWFTGCEGCVQMVPAMKAVESRFDKDSNIVFLNVSIDRKKELWLQSVKKGKYTTGRGINLYTGGDGDDNDMIRKYGIQGYPSLLLLDPWGKMISTFPKPDPRFDSGYALTKILQKYQAYLNDGPYILYEKDSSFEYFINGNSVSRRTLFIKDSKTVMITPGVNDRFSVLLKDSLVTEPSKFPKPEKILVLSDIEGEYEAFKNLLIVNHVIDENYNWTFKKGHVVFNGDMFDRGEQVAECLWLIYYLEQKAKLSGGYVHFVLGNHEVMNLRGDDRYSHPKYNHNRTLLNKTQKELYGNNSELGRWLRTKNIMEKIGDLMFVHGGIGKEFSDSISLSIEEVNDLFRKNIDVVDLIGKETRLIFSSYYSPFWFRLYYDDGDQRLTNARDTSVKIHIHHPSDEQLSDILVKWDVNRIITGHTIVNDTISLHYDGKVVNTDTRHAKGQSEALLVEGYNYFRVDKNGDRKLLFNDRNKQARSLTGW